MVLLLVCVGLTCILFGLLFFRFWVLLVLFFSLVFVISCLRPLGFIHMFWLYCDYCYVVGV